MENNKYKVDVDRLLAYRLTAHSVQRDTMITYLPKSYMHTCVRPYLIYKLINLIDR